MLCSRSLNIWLHALEDSRIWLNNLSHFLLRGLGVWLLVSAGLEKPPNKPLKQDIMQKSIEKVVKGVIKIAKL